MAVVSDVSAVSDLDDVDALEPTPWVGQSSPASSRTRPRTAVPMQAPLEFEHNPFCPDCVEPDAPAGEPSTAEQGPVASALPLQLLATMESEPPAPSLATLAASGWTGAFAVGDVVMPGVRLARVDQGVVLLDHEGSLELLEIGAEPSKPKLPREPKAKTTRSTSSRRRAWEIEGAEDAVDCDGWQCTIEREFIETLTRNPALLTSQARALPYSSEGLRGFRLSRVRRGTLPQLLGLRSGDVVTEINGRALETMDAALMMASRLRSSSHLSVALTRNRGGERYGHQLEIQIVS